MKKVYKYILILSFFFTTNAFSQTITKKDINNILQQKELFLNNGKTLKLSDLKGKVVLLDFWYRGCLPCIKAIPKLNDLQKKYNDKLVVIGINDIDEKDQVTDFLTYKKVNYSSTYKSEINISKSLNFNAFPTIVILDKSGKIAEISSGINERKLKTLIKKLINK